MNLNDILKFYHLNAYSSTNEGLLRGYPHWTPAVLSERRMNDGVDGGRVLEGCGVRVAIDWGVSGCEPSPFLFAGISIATSFASPSWLSLVSADGATTAPPLHGPMEML